MEALAGGKLRVDRPAPHVTRLEIHNPAKRNAINDTLIAQLHSAFVSLPEAVKAVVLTGEGDHFCIFQNAIPLACCATSTVATLAIACRS